MPHSHSDFELPGLSSRRLASWIVAIAFAYSGKWNSRNLENHFYAFWSLVLLDLVDDLAPDTIIIPQFQFDTIDGTPVAPDDSIATTAQATAKEITPDFTIAIFHLVRRHNPVTLSIPPILFPLITEVKHPATRRAKSRKHFGEALEVQLGFAQADLVKQVEHVFLMQPGAKNVILLACSGEWWSWMFATRAAQAEGFILPNFLEPEDAEEPEINNTPHDIPESRAREHLPRDKKKAVKGMYLVPSPSPPSESEKLPYKPRQKGSTATEGEEQRTGGEIVKICCLNAGRNLGKEEWRL